MRAEFVLEESEHQAIAQLLKSCFPTYPDGRTYLSQLPTFRVLVTRKGVLVGHSAVDERMISLPDGPARVYCVSDVCVHPAYQQQQIGRQMLDVLSRHAVSRRIAFLLLTALEDGLYQAAGFTAQRVSCRWLFLKQHQSLGILRRDIDQFMVKTIGERPWPTSGEIDLLGTIF